MTRDDAGQRVRDILQFPARETESIVIEHVTVVPMDRPGHVPDQTIVIEDGRIATVGPTRAVPAGARVIDGRGRFVMPGLADMHVHLWDLSDHAMFLANGVTTVRNMWGAPMHLALRQRVKAHDIPGPHVFTTSPIVDGPGPSGRTVWPNSPMVRDGEDPTALIQGFSARGYQQVKVYSWLGREAHRAVCAAARAVDMPVTGHCPDRMTFEEAIANGQRCFEHLQNVRNGHFPPDVRMPDPLERSNRLALARLTVERLDMDSIRRLAHEMALKDIWNCPTTVVWQQMIRPREESLNDPELRYMSQATITTWDPRQDFRFRDQPIATQEYHTVMSAQIEVYVRIISILHAEGAPLLIGTDTPNPFVIPGFSIHHELANLRAAGLSPYDALRAGTTEAARFVGEQSEWGTVSAGKRADLLLLRKDPLEDLGALRAIDGVAVNGYWLDRDQLDRLLDARVASVGSAAQVRPELDAAADEPLRGGTLRESVTGAEVGRLVYRHRSSATGLTVEERSATGEGRGSGQVRTVKLDLDADFTLRAGTVVTELPLGTERIEIEARASQLTVRSEEIDGHRSNVSLAGPLVPSDRLSPTALAALLASRGAGEMRVRALSVDVTGPVALDVAAASADGSTWSVEIPRTGELTKQTYTVSRDGRLTRLDEVNFRGQRSLEIEES